MGGLAAIDFPYEKATEWWPFQKRRRICDCSFISVPRSPIDLIGLTIFHCCLSLLITINKVCNYGGQKAAPGLIPRIRKLNSKSVVIHYALVSL